MKKRILIMVHQIANKARTYHAMKLRKWTEIDNNVCSKF